MASKQIKARIPKPAARAERNGANARGNGGPTQTKTRSLLVSTRQLAGKTVTGARRHPIALLGAAVAAGVVIAGAVWRRTVGR